MTLIAEIKLKSYEQWQMIKKLEQEIDEIRKQTRKLEAYSHIHEEGR